MGTRPRNRPRWRLRAAFLALFLLPNALGMENKVVVRDKYGWLLFIGEEVESFEGHETNPTFKGRYYMVRRVHNLELEVGCFPEYQVESLEDFANNLKPDDIMKAGEEQPPLGGIITEDAL